MQGTVKVAIPHGLVDDPNGTASRSELIDLFLIKIYYKMFFLITHILIGKYYPNLFAQFIIGCSFFIIAFLVIKDIFSGYNFSQYKYYILALVIVDILFVIYLTKTKMTSKKIVKNSDALDFIKKTENTSSDVRTGAIQSISLSSELNDYKVSHNLSSSDDKNSLSIFSNSDEKSDGNSDKKSDEKNPTKQSNNKELEKQIP